MLVICRHSLKGKLVEIVITEWALDSYLDLNSQSAFTDAEYKQDIRPDVLRLKTYPNDPKFAQSKFWSPAEDGNGNRIKDGFKMKWHQMGHGKVQIRLPIAMFTAALLCEAYVKENSKQENRRLARFKVHMQLIRMGRYTARGRLS